MARGGEVRGPDDMTAACMKAARPAWADAPSGGLVERLGAGLAAVAILAVAMSDTSSSGDREAAEPAPPATMSRLADGRDLGRETAISFYIGAPYTHASDVKFSKPPGTNLTVHDVGWDARPFQNPIYYGARIARWREDGLTGGMLDFTHSKTISRRKQEVRLTGTRDGVRAPASTKVEDLFRHLEFSHGHNMLTLNGLYRLPRLGARLSPYVGGGVGIAVPHTEVQFRGDPVRTYEYQYTGPVAQALIGIEFRVPRMTYYLEYKFSIALYNAPLTNRDGGWAFSDFYHQFLRWWSGKPPEGGWASTTLISHQVIGGVGARITGAAPATAAGP